MTKEVNIINNGWAKTKIFQSGIKILKLIKAVYSDSHI